MASTSHLLARFEGAHGATVSILANDSRIRLCKTEHFESISVLVLNDESNERRRAAGNAHVHRLSLAG